MAATPKAMPTQRDEVKIKNSIAAKISFLSVMLVLCAIGITSVLTYQQDKREMREFVSRNLLTNVRGGAGMVDGDEYERLTLHPETSSTAFKNINKLLARIGTSSELSEDIYTIFFKEGQAFVFIRPFGEISMPLEDTFIKKSKASALFMATRKSSLVVPVATNPAMLRAYEEGAALFTDIYEKDGQKWLSAYAPITNSKGKIVGLLAIDYPVRLLDKRAQKKLYWIGFYADIGFLVALFLSLLLARTITNPLKKVVEGTRRIQRGEYEPIPEVKSSDEVGLVASSFNQMVKELREREFIKDLFGRYVSPAVADQVLRNQGSIILKGERRRVSVLFADIRGFTALSEALSPEELLETLNESFTVMVEAVLTFGGTVDKFMGDAIMAYFGAPFSPVGLMHEEQALRTSLVIQRRLMALNEERVKKNKLSISVGIGISSGEAVAGNIGSEKRLNYTLIGSVVNRAERLCSIALRGQILIDEQTSKVLSGLVEVRRLTEAENKISSHLAAVYAVIYNEKISDG